MSNAPPHTSAAVAAARAVRPQEVYIYGHSSIIYWWPVWAVGYLFALLSYLQGVPTHVGNMQVIIHPSKNLGVIFTMVFLLVILLTHISVRGAASATVIVTMIAVTLFLAYMDWWEVLLESVGKLAIFMNLGFYVFFSTSVFLVWALAVFVVDRMEYWVVRPGQLVHYQVFGGGEQSYDTRGMSVTKLRSDLFRHWVLGLGAGDLHIAATGAKPSGIYDPQRHVRRLEGAPHQCARGREADPAADQHRDGGNAGVRSLCRGNDRRQRIGRNNPCRYKRTSKP